MNKKSTEKINQIEAKDFAYLFAQNLLMPEKAVKKVFNEKKCIWETALYFGVPVEKLKERLVDLKLISPSPTPDLCLKN